MKKSALLAAGLTLCVAAGAFAAEPQLYRTPDEKRGAGVLNPVGQTMTLSGLIEADAFVQQTNYTKKARDAGAPRDEDSSDILLKTLNLRVNAKVNENIDVTALGGYDSAQDKLDLDEGFIAYKNDAWFAELGRFYVPFGEYPSFMLSEPMTQLLGETRDEAVLVGKKLKVADVALFGFNSGEGSDDHVKTLGASVKFVPGEGMRAGVSVISDLSATDRDLLDGRAAEKRIPAVSGFFMYDMGKFDFCSEVLAAVQKYKAEDLDADGNGKGDQPLAWHLDGAFAVADNFEVAATLAGSQKAAGLPEFQTGLKASWGPWEHVVLGAEIMHNEFDKKFGMGVDTSDVLTARLSVEF